MNENLEVVINSSLQELTQLKSLREHSQFSNFLDIKKKLSSEDIKIFIEQVNFHIKENLKAWNDTDYYLRYLYYVENSDLQDLIEKTITETVHWLKSHLDKSVFTKYLHLVNKYGTKQQVEQALDKTLVYLTENLDEGTILSQYLTLVENRGSARHIEKAIDASLKFLESIPSSSQASSAWQKFLKVIENYASPAQRNRAIEQVIKWLNCNPQESRIRQKYISLIEHKGTISQNKQAIENTQVWLEEYPEDKEVRRQFFGLIEKSGTPQQKQTFIKKILRWLEDHQDDEEIRRNLLCFIKGHIQYLENPYEIFVETIEWLQKKEITSISFWISFLSTFHSFIKTNYFPSYKVQEILEFSLQQHGQNNLLINMIFSCYRDYLNYTLAYNLADSISNESLETTSSNSWQNIILAGNFFRDYECFDKAKKCYSIIWNQLLPTIEFEEIALPEETLYKLLSIINAQAKNSSKYSQIFIKNVEAILLSYAYLLNKEHPYNPDQAIKCIDIVLTRNPQHSFAFWQLAICYETKGEEYYQQVIYCYKKAILFDRRATARLSFEFANFYLYKLYNLQKSREYLEISLSQNVNLPACITMAELEVMLNNYKQAKKFLKQGLALVPETRIEVEQRKKFENRIQCLIDNCALSALSTM